MWTRAPLLLALGLLWPAPAAAQDPLSAIQWLDREMAAFPERARPAEPPVTDSAAPGEISVSPIGRPSKDAVGLIPARIAGLPEDLWAASDADDLSARLRGMEPGMLPSMRRLLYTLLLTELDPPADSAPEGPLFLARVDTLMRFGAVEQARALLERAGADRPESFRRYFDAALLTGTEDAACAALRSRPNLSPGFAARIFCLARSGDWEAAALTLETARALGFLSAYEDALLVRFLDPALFEGLPPLAPPSAPSPLVFRVAEAIGEPIPTTTLPLSFAQADLRANIGWKAQLEAAERLARSGAVPANRLLGLYTERQPAASGGIWDRVQAVRRLDAALGDGDAGAAAEALPVAWRALEAVELESVLAELFAPRLTSLGLSGEAGELVFRMGLLTEDYERAAAAARLDTQEDRFLAALARGRPGDIPPPDGFAAAIAEGFGAGAAPARLRGLLQRERLGEAILRAMALIEGGARGDLDELTDAIALFRAVGMEDVARRAALEVMILDRRG